MAKEKLTLYDRLTRVKKNKNFSLWKGRNGSLYFFKHLNNNDPDKKSPIVQVYKNRQYLTGLFSTKKPDIFTGDMKTEGKKCFLIFKLQGRNSMTIFINS